MSFTANPVVPDWLTVRAIEKPDVVAVESGPDKWTYSELFSRAVRVAEQLDNIGLEPGDRIGLLAKHGLSICQAVHGIIQAGAVVVPLNVRLTVDELLWQVRHAGVRCILFDEVYAGTAAEIRQRLHGEGHEVRLIHLEVFTDGQTNGRSVAVRQGGINLNRPFGIIYTSGTSGTPKGCVLTYGNFWWSAMASTLLFGLNPAERWLVPLPLFHVGGLSVLIRSLIYGTTAVIHDAFDERAVNRALVEDDITCLSVVPTMLARMLQVKDGPYGLALRFVLLGGSGVSQSLLRECIRERIPVAPSYGLSESCSQAVTLAPSDVVRKLGSSGRPLLPNQLRIVRPDGSLAAADEPGEIALCGPTITSGYWNNEDATRAVISDGWLTTGDFGYVDADGYLFVLDRRSDLIVSGGENIYPAELEQVIVQHPSIVDAGVVPMADPVWGQVPVAFVCTATAAVLDEATLTAFCRSHLAHYKVPKQFRVVPELPRNASGKLLRRTLRTWL